MVLSRAPILATLMLTAVLAGCIAGDSGDTDLPDEPETPTWAFSADLALPSGQAARDFVESYVMAHPYRLNGAATQDFMAAARDALESILGGHNITVQRHEFESRSDTNQDAPGVNMLGIINGTTNPEQWVVISAHYDTTESTVYGAWDDGTGVAALLALAEVLPTWDLPFTVVLAFFDEEEQGLVGSEHFAKEFDESEAVELVANINLDPPGLNWPCGDAGGAFPVKIIHDMEKVNKTEELPRFDWLYRAVETGLGAAAVPEDVRDYTPGIPIAQAQFPVEVPGLGDAVGLTGTSDHANFNALDIANVYIGGTPTSFAGPDDGPRVAALTYPLHTPLDTLEAVEARCTEGSLAEGLQTTVTTVVHTLAYMAETGVPAY